MIISHTLLDKMECEESSEKIPVLKESLENNSELTEDIFAGMYKFKPEILEIPPDRMLEGQVLISSIGSNEWQDIHEKTKLNGILAGVAAGKLFAVVSNTINEIKERHKDDPPSDNQKNIAPDYSGDITECRAKMRTDFKAVVDDMENIENALRLFGNEPGSGNAISEEDLFYMVNELSKRASFLSKIVDLAGRYVNILTQSQTERCEYIPSEIVDIVPSNSLSNLLPHEVAYYYKARPYFEKKYVEKTLMCFKKEDTDSKRCGPIIVCIDVSGSMRGDNMVRAMSIFVAFATIARQQDRCVWAILYDSSVVLSESVDTQKDILKIALSTVGGGGTDFSAPLEEALKIFQNSPKSDIIFITDGQSSCNEQIVDAVNYHRTEKGLKVYAVLIETYNSDTLKPFSDKIYVEDDETLFKEFI